MYTNGYIKVVPKMVPKIVGDFFIVPNKKGRFLSSFFDNNFNYLTFCPGLFRNQQNASAHQND